jgi:formylglycine-generating enzyme required for sulfatase activity
MVCIPGGAFLLGSENPAVSVPDYPSLPERLVEMSPFALDIDEFTVGDFRALLMANQFSDEPTRQVGAPNPPTGACTYLGPDDDTNDDLPLNCVSFDLASAICAAMGKELPTEAQWEWAAGNRDEESPYPWGQDGDVCAHSVVGLGRMLGVIGESIECLSGSAKTPGGPLSGGRASDVTVDGVHNLGGNVSEWVADSVAFYTDPCWSTAPLADPECAVANPQLGMARSLRGGSWNSSPVTAQAALRDYAPIGSGNEQNGFRCAKGF